MSRFGNIELKASKILSVGSYVPPRVVLNQELVSMLDTSDEWIQQRTGIKQRHWVEPGVATSDLAFEATKRALVSAEMEAKQIEMIIFATISPDHEFPGSACFLQAKLGIPGIPVLDIRQQCTGFVYALSIADQFIKTGVYKNILVVGAEIHSKGLDKTPKGRDVSVLFGDGAGAVIVTATPAEDSSGPKILSSKLHADGNYAKELWTEAPGFALEERINEAFLKEGKQFPKMNGKTVFVHASKRMPEAVMEVLNENELKLEDVDLFLFHQANLRINEMVAKQLGIPENKVFNTIDRFANTTAATLPLGMDEAIKAGALKPGMLVAMAAFGSGFTWGSVLFRW